MQPVAYTYEDDAVIIRMINAGQSYSEVGKVLARSAGGIQSRCKILRRAGLLPPPTPRREKTLQLQARREPIPDYVIKERDHAYAAPRTSGMAYLGEPLPGRSALDRARGTT